jgi:hypothetical protein
MRYDRPGARRGGDGVSRDADDVAADILQVFGLAAGSGLRSVGRGTQSMVTAVDWPRAAPWQALDQEHRACPGRATPMEAIPGWWERSGVRKARDYRWHSAWYKRVATALATEDP